MSSSLHFLIFGVLLLLGLTLDIFCGDVHRHFSFSQDYAALRMEELANEPVFYKKGDLPLVITAPHGGWLLPDSIPDRKSEGALLKGDKYTRYVAGGVAEQVSEYFGGAFPYLIICNVSRRKVDVNRPLEDGAESPGAKRIWKDYHTAVQNAVKEILNRFGHGLLLDIHGHGHRHGMVELGYLLYKDELRDLSDEAVLSNSSIQSLALRNVGSTSPTTLLRGNESFGDLMNSAGNSVLAVPSSRVPFPSKDDLYFRGGYTTQRYHASNTLHNGLDVIQIELPQKLRFTANGRSQAIASISDAATLLLYRYYPLQARARL